MLTLGHQAVCKTFLRAAMIGLALAGACAGHSQAEDVWGQVRKAIEKSTLDQPGTRPFHLKATFAPTQDRNSGTHHEGEIEIWWLSPTQWRREVRCPQFHQIAIRNGDRVWQKNDGDYFPEWLEELATAIIRPVPLPEDVLEERVKTAEVRQLMGQTNVNWEATTSYPDEKANGKGYIALTDKSGLLFYTGGPGFGGLYHDFKNFHGRMVAMTVAAGYVEVTAKVSLLEDLGAPANGLFDADAPGGDPLINTVAVSESELHSNLIAAPVFAWPPLKDGPLDGVVWTEVALDRSGTIREMIPPIADNPAVIAAAEAGFKAMRFRPILRNGVPVQAVGRFSVSFKAVRPAGIETFESARTYFERGRKASFLAAGSKAPYKLEATFEIGTRSGIETGRYEDIWINASEWKREAWFGSSHLVKSQSGDKRYLLAEGSQSGLLRIVMQFMEPIPAEDTMTESDWRIRREMVEGLKSIRVARGDEGPNGELNTANAEAFWFDDAGHLLKCYTAGFDVRMALPTNYEGVDVPRRIDVLKDGKLGMRITVKDIGPADQALARSFILKGHEWQRAFTAEVR